MSTQLELPCRPNGSAEIRPGAIVVVPPVLIPPRLARVPNLRAVPMALSDDPIIYALCTSRRVAPGRYESEALYVGLTEDLHRRISEWRTIWWSEHREPFDTVLWWPHPARWMLDHEVSPRAAEEAFVRFLLPRYNRPRPAGLSGQHRKALRLHGIEA